MSDTRTRASQRRHAQRKRDAAWATQCQGRVTCPTRHGRYGECGAVLQVKTDGHGRLTIRCPKCERRRRGICQDCPRRVDGAIGKALRCAACKAAALAASLERYRVRHADEIRAAQRKRSRDPKVRRRRLAYKRLYRLAHPERVRAWKRKEALSQNPRRLAYAKTYNAARRAAKAAAVRARYQLDTPVPAPTCCECDRMIPWHTRNLTDAAPTGRPPKRCVFCMARTNPGGLRRQVMTWAIRSDDAPVERAPTPDLLARGQRLCINAPGCRRVVSGKRKKCEECLTSEQAAAMQALAARRGRGRRTDLEGRAA